MSEHWKSTPKYWCKHCTTYVKDTSFERKQHENTGKHQGNLRRFLQGIQKDHAQNERNKDKAKAEIERLNRIAGTPSGLGAGPSSAKPASSPAVTKAPRNDLSATDQKRQWAQLAEMGIAIPEHARPDVAMAGNWQTVSKRVEIEPEEHIDEKLNVGVRKRKLNDDEESEGGVRENTTVARKGWGATTRTYPGSIPVDHDLNDLLSRPLLKKEKAAKNEPPPDDKVSSLVSKMPDPGLPTIKSENSDTIDRESLDVQAAQISSLHTTSRRASETKGETFHDDAKAEDQEVYVPVFKKRKAKQPPATKA